MSMQHFGLISLVSLVLLCAEVQGVQGVVVTSGTEYLADDFTYRDRVEGGYEIEASAIPKAKVVFPANGWKYMSRTLPGGGYVIDPATGAALRFDGVAFGRRLNSFFLWMWTSSEHQWAEKFTETKGGQENQT